MSVADVREWKPYGVIKYNGWCNVLGVVYALPVDIDRTFWHKPINIFREEP
jgi:hypothetical protein